MRVIFCLLMFVTAAAAQYRLPPVLVDDTCCYETAVKRAEKSGKPLLIFIGNPAINVDGCETVSVPLGYLEGLNKPGILVATKQANGKLGWTQTLPLQTPTADIRTLLGLEVRPQVVSFPAAASNCRT